MVHRLERDLEEAIAEVIDGFEGRLPFRPSQHTIHLMSKAAVTVYEAALDSPPPRPPRDDQR
ncbi:MAG: hypothetical protein R3C49_03235 [Planctomycetaceae bacterium]